MRLNKARFREVTEAGFRECIAAGIRNQREAYGTGENSVKRCLMALREECPKNERNFYVGELD